MDAATRQRIRHAIDRERRRTHPWVPDSRFAVYDGVCGHCRAQFEPTFGRMYCSEKCRKKASQKRSRGSRAAT